MTAKDCAICETNRHVRTYLTVPDLRGKHTALLRCETCGLVYVDESLRRNRAFAGQSGAENIEEQWRDEFPDSLDVYGDQEWGTIYQNQQDAIRRQYEEVVRVFGFTSSTKATLLEIGAARGYLLAELARHHPQLHLIGVEPSPVMAGHIREAGIQVINGVLEDGELDPESIDGAVGFGSFIQIRDPLNALRHLNKAMKPGAKLLLDSPNDDSLIRVLYRLACRSRTIARQLDARYGRFLRLIYNPARFYFYTRATYSRLLDAAGFEVVETATRQPRFLEYGKHGLSAGIRVAAGAMSLAERATGRSGWVQVVGVKTRSL